MDYIKLEFSATECNGWPKCKFYIDSDLIEDYEFNSATGEITLPVELMDGDHLLTVELYGKTNRNTIVENNQIVRDQLVTLKNIYLNDIKLPDFYKYNGVYSYHDQRIPQGLIWGVNGVWEWPFDTPIVNWALDFKYAHREKYSDKVENELLTTQHTRAKVEKTIESLNRLTEILNAK